LHLGALLGAAVGSAVLIGALVVGDSVRGSLRDMALQRLAGATLAMDTGDRFFTAALFDRMVALGSNDAVRVNSPPTRQGITWGQYRNFAMPILLRLSATVTRQDDAARANRVALYGVEEQFLRGMTMPAEDEVLLNESLARQLNAKTGDELIVRMHKPSALSRDAVIVPRDDASIALRLKVAGIVPPEPGNFSLVPSQTPPLNAFIRLDRLGKAAGLEGRANLLVVGELFETRPPTAADHFKHAIRELTRGNFKNRGTLFSVGRVTYSSEAVAKIQSFLNDAWTLEDVELNMRLLPPPLLQMNGALLAPTAALSTPRIFLDPEVARAALTPASNLTGSASAEPVTNGMQVLTYLVNLIRAGDRSAPYSMVSALSPPGVATNMADDEILINDWLANDLTAGPGDRLELSYYVLDAGSQLLERTNAFRIRGVIPMRGLYADPALMPEFPGLAKAESTHDWDAGFKLVNTIRDQDEAYWKKYRGTPKAFITLSAGQKMWANRFGNLTSIRWPARLYPGGATSVTNLAINLRANLRPEHLGLRLEPVRERALQSAEQAQNFGGLFVGFSFFLIVAALLLMALLFQFSVEQRATEVGTLLALGFTPKQVRRLLMFEGGALALAGGLLGMLGGFWYARAMLHGLSTVWRDAVGTSALGFHAEPLTLAIGVVSAIGVAWLTIWLALRKQARQPARELLAEGAAEKLQAPGSKLQPNGRARWLIVLSALGALSLIGWAVGSGDTANAGVFFGAGALLLIAGLAFASAYLSRLAAAAGGELPRFSLSELGLRNCARRRTRSLSTLGLLACGSFLIASIGVFRLDAVKGSEKRSSGTGGFQLIGESSFPVVHDLNTPSGREFFGLDDKSLEGVQVVPLRVRDGDDASCLNLNRAQRPRLLGVKPELLAEREAFTFAKVAKGLPGKNPWLLLKTSTGGASYPSSRDSDANLERVTVREEPLTTEEAIVPAIGDANSIQWAMGKKVGDTIDYTDDRGRSFKIRLVGAVANSMLQGSLLIDEAEFLKRFPSEAGYRMFLIDGPSKGVSEVSTTLTRALRDVGMELTPTATRLAAFNAVQNTYLGTFQILGGLGLLLGSVGLGVVVLRNVLERRGELALLLAVGFRPGALKWLVMSEHGALLMFGLGIGVLAALVAVLPAVLSPGAEVPYASLGLTLVGVLVSGVFWTWLATAAALRGRLLDGLRNE
jgi:ABC-type antimicrobial peptide transport system permease subunit